MGNQNGDTRVPARRATTSADGTVVPPRCAFLRSSLTVMVGSLECSEGMEEVQGGVPRGTSLYTSQPWVIAAHRHNWSLVGNWSAPLCWTTASTPEHSEGKVFYTL
ncbi:hypothetical protein SKAU_G00221530 [Synaphobranchus kaupii]|uniref:Uncharacterized protein n=1 Tax=Synaphobranchus kaupii TaxID=118154 RepID=A0A9Q1IVX0_SYNKA|nr:hypothetical protein SKAU_G00221530 [Synaphobranchus kaupii]